MELFLTLLSGIAWMIVYEECIRLGFKEKSYAMPLFALGLNFSWEAINFVGEIAYNWHGELTGLTLVQVIVNGLWAILDIVILLTYILYGRKWWPSSVNRKAFYHYIALVIVTCFAIQIAFILEFGGVLAAEYSAFLQNLIMSVMFIFMFAKRGNMEGQSILLAVSKWIGTLAPSILMGVIAYNVLVLVTGIFCSVFDLIYIAMLALYKRKRKALEIARQKA